MQFDFRRAAMLSISHAKENKDTMIGEKEIADFWETHPCGESASGSNLQDDYETFFRTYDAWRYQKEAHIPACLDQIDFRGKKVLEIGLGLGADSEQIIRRGASWCGLDLTKGSVDRVLARFEVRNLPYDTIKVGSALDIPFTDNSFDIVFSHGVLHHIPEACPAGNPSCTQA
ncbi:class I SAM-dependent methyltransferase [Bradyrhizobium guangzhouense]|uniref:class I SAM-dependent methyltransferase n=1 Tax=Bradyrhizobium guangzhouense TaxID=1325095 RepID=UPI001009FC46|nr:class I SAM-dependent methyltransferase [Bradyrhizobium guangzhouense]RXH16952.1 class I SAM-dependent methyltransferase [Bradyrhizobium guangzhouense]